MRQVRAQAAGTDAHLVDALGVVALHRDDVVVDDAPHRRGERGGHGTGGGGLLTQLGHHHVGWGVEAGAEGLGHLGPGFAHLGTGPAQPLDHRRQRGEPGVGQHLDLDLAEPGRHPAAVHDRHLVVVDLDER